MKGIIDMLSQWGLSDEVLGVGQGGWSRRLNHWLTGGVVTGDAQLLAEKSYTTGREFTGFSLAYYIYLTML